MRRFMVLAIAVACLSFFPGNAEAHCPRTPVRTVLKGVVRGSVNVAQGVRYSIRNTVQGVRVGFAQARCN